MSVLRSLLILMLLTASAAAQTVFVLGGYSSSATTIQVRNGNLLPDPPQYLDWYDYSHYSHPVCG